jgi:branched-chain amino acid transport system permease protein
MQVLLNGLVSGLMIASLSLAFAVVYLSTQIFHVALGGVYVLVPFVAWTCLQYGFGWTIAITTALTAGIVLSIACELLNHRWLDRKQVGSGAHTISSLGIYLIVAQMTALIWGNEPKVLREGLDQVFQIGTGMVTLSQIMAAVVSVLAIAFFYGWLYLSKRGLQFRAMSSNPQEIVLRGYNINRLRLLAFGLSGLLSTISSLLFAYDVGFDPNAGLITTLLAIVAFVVGGQNSFWGSVVGGILLGLLRSLTIGFLSTSWQDAITFFVLVAFLVIRPQGILGKQTRLEAEE